MALQSTRNNTRLQTQPRKRKIIKFEQALHLETEHVGENVCMCVFMCVSVFRMPKHAKDCASLCVFATCVVFCRLVIQNVGILNPSSMPIKYAPFSLGYEY